MQIPKGQYREYLVWRLNTFTPGAANKEKPGMACFTIGKTKTADFKTK